MAWGSSFDKTVKGKDIADQLTSDTQEAISGPLNKSIQQLGEVLIELIPPTPPVDQQWSTGALIFKDMTKAEVEAKYGKHNNKVPTHDPYTNPNAHIYYECKCGQILDPGTKRFAELNNCASNAGWKIRFSDTGYIPYCVDCGKGVE